LVILISQINRNHAPCPARAQSPGILKKLREQILFETVDDSNIYEADILKTYHFVLDQWINDYKSYRTFSPHILHTFEKHFNKSFSYSLYIYFQLYEQVLNLPVKKKFDSSIINIEPTDSSVEKIQKGFRR
jgi:hypothetical protein